MIAISKIINSMLGCSRNWKFQLVTNWPTIVGSLATRMHIEKIEHDSIIIGVCDSAWLQELYMLSDVLLQKINQSLPSPYIKKIIFKHAYIQHKKIHRHITTKQKSTHTEQPLTERERNALASIHDPELSNALHQFLIRCQQTTNH